MIEWNKKGEANKQVRELHCSCGCDVFLEGIKINENGKHVQKKPMVYICYLCGRKMNFLELKRII